MIANTPPFKYDAALSLLDADLATAKSIAGLLEQRIGVFLYSERQLELAGTDGADEFTSVFRRDARVVVVLLRNHWGSTKWTRIEETAIKNRGFDEGYDFLLVVPLDGSTSIPDWVPRTHIWADLDRLGIAGAVAVIERKVAERGRVVRPEAAEDVEARLAKERQEQIEREQFLGSTDGVRVADAEFARMKELIRLRHDRLQIRVNIECTTATLRKDYRSLTITWSRTYRNMLKASRLRLTLWDGIASEHIDPSFRAQNTMSELMLQLDRYHGTVGWRESGGKRRFFTTDALVERALTVLVKAAYGEHVSF